MINNDLVIKDVDNFTITGIGQCTIICTSPASIVIMNVENIEVLNINLINRTQNHKVYFNVNIFPYETCFYDGMDGYTKMWLQLVFPSYLMIISFTLIIGSRYSSI